MVPFYQNIGLMRSNFTKSVSEKFVFVRLFGRPTSVYDLSIDIKLYENMRWLRGFGDSRK